MYSVWKITCFLCSLNQPKICKIFFFLECLWCVYKIFILRGSKEIRLFSLCSDRTGLNWDHCSIKKSLCVTALWEIKILRPIAPNSELCNIRECIVRALNPRSHNSACSNVTVIAVMQTFPPSTDAWVRQPSFPVNDLQANNSHEKQKRNTCILLEKLLIHFGHLDHIHLRIKNFTRFISLSLKGGF